MIPGTDTRLCVDCRAGDNSSVFHREMLDEGEEFTNEALPWCFDHDHGPTEFYATEDEACAAQRAYRIQHDLDPISGNAKKTVTTRDILMASTQKPVCSDCGSDDVRADAYAVWNMERQDWELSATFDKGSVCENCGGECSLDWIEIETPNPGATNADLHD